jgi:hypothetical protein
VNVPDGTSSVNVPWPTKGMTDADYIHAFQQIVMPIALEFAPELVISMSGKRFVTGTFTVYTFLHSFGWF